MNRFNFVIIASLSSFFLLSSADARTYNQSNHPTSVLASSTTTPAEISQLAQAITVKVLAANKSGSGVLITKQGQTYTILTNAHVISPKATHRIQTPDGKIHSAVVIKRGDSLKGNDLALLQFKAKANYRIVTLATASNLSSNQEVFAAGFPYDSKELVISSGKISLLSPQPLIGGYQIGYTNEIQQGMSGGPLLNKEGKLVGVNGLLNNAILNDAYLYQDGSRPSNEQLQRLKQFSFAVPIQTLAQVAPNKPAIPPKQDNQQQASKPTVANNTVDKVDKIAQQITVSIDSKNNGNGSGVIVAKQGQTYYVLTAAHVVENADQYQVLTPDGQSYPIKFGTITILEGVDLAVVPFTSNRTYSVAKLAKYNIGREETEWVFASGFPAATLQKSSTLQRRLTVGLVFSQERADFQKKDSYSFAEGSGYELVYTNLSLPGMSGGPVLDRLGRVIGINAAAENENVNQKGQLVEINLGLSLGVPIGTFLSLTTKAKIQPQWLQVETTAPPVTTRAENASIRENLFSLEAPDVNSSENDWLNYGNLWFRSFRFEEAVAAFSQAIKRKPDFYQAYYAGGLTLRFLNKYQAAIAVLDKAIELQPKLYEAWRERSTALSELKRYPEALASIDQAIQIEPRDFRLYALRGDLLSELKRYPEAVNSLSQALKIRSHPFLYRTRGIAYYESGKYQQAIADFTQAIQLQPDYDTAYMERGIAYKKLGNYQQALADYTKAIQLKPDHARSYYNRGNAYSDLKKYQEALADYNKAIQLNPDYVTAYGNRADVYQELGKYEQALADHNKAIQIQPDRAYSYFNRGLFYDESEKYQEAIADYTKAIQLQSDDADAYNNRGNVYQRLGKFQQALADHTKAIQLQPDYALAYNNRGHAYMALGEYQQALSDLNKAIELQPDLHLAFNNRGRVYSDLGKYQQAIADFNRAIQLKPDATEIYLNRGFAYLKLKNYQQAIADFDRAIQRQPELANAYKYRGIAYALLLESNLVLPLETLLQNRA